MVHRNVRKKYVSAWYTKLNWVDFFLIFTILNDFHSYEAARLSNEYQYEEWLLVFLFNLT